MDEKSTTFSDEEIRSIIKFLWQQGKARTEILSEINQTIGDCAVSKTNVCKWVKRFENKEFDTKTGKRSGRPKKDNLIPQVEHIITSDPFVSSRAIAASLSVHKNTISRILKVDLGMKKVSLHWIPHELSDLQKRQRVEMSHEMLQVLTTVRYHSTILTGDETFLYWKNPRNSMWQEAGLPPPSRERKTIGSKKLMVCVIWTTSGMKSITKLPRGASFNQEFFQNVVLADLFKTIEKERPVKKSSEMKIHIDNARPHLVDAFLQDNGLTRLQHPPYSPDLAPSDFFLFGFLKMQMEGKNFESDEELFDAASNVLRCIPNTTLRDVYHEWIQRLKRCIEMNGEYVE